MPVNIDGKTFADHKSAVEHLKKSKPEIKDPDAYVATVERSMKGASLKARLQKIAGYDDTCPNCGSKNVTKNTSGERTCNNCGLSPTKEGDKSKTAAKDTTIDFPPASRYYECATCGDSFDSREEFNQHKSDSGHPKTETKQTRESQLKARLQKLAGEGMTFGGACPECTGKGKQYRDNCPTCEGTGKQMYPYSK